MFSKFLTAVLLSSSIVLAHNIATEPQTVLIDLSVAKAAGGVILSHDEQTGLAVVRFTPLQLSKVSQLGHSQKKCAGFEALNSTEASAPGLVIQQFKKTIMKDLAYSPFDFRGESKIVFNEAYKNIIDQALPDKLKENVVWLSSYPNRYNKSTTPNKHVEDLKLKLNQWLQGAPWKYTIETIVHKSTPQNSLKVTITGAKKPNEIIVLGGHLDSINQLGSQLPIPVASFNNAPGADDNASGSANLIEALKLLKQVPSFDRTLEFYWYAGEESGLLGSAEIAQKAKADKRNVIAVLQLDMTLFPGDGEQVVGLMTDFTSPWLRSVLTEINDVYVRARLVDSKCGYGCSDHASWNRQGYNAVIPFEATMGNDNKNIHTTRDVIDSKSSFTHSNTFTKYATLFALVLGNSELKAP